MNELTIILAFVIGAVVAFIIANLMNKNKNVPKAELEALQKSLDSANQEKAQLSSYKQQLEDTKKELSTVRDSFIRSEEDKNIAQTNLANSNAKIEELEKKHKSLEDNNNQLQNDILSLKEENAKHQANAESAKNELNEKNTKLSEFESTTKTLNTQLREKVDELATAKSNLESTKSLLEEKNTKLSEFESTTKTLNTQLREKVDELATAKSNLESAKSLLEEKSEKYDALFNFNTEQTEELNSVKNENSEYKAKYEALNEKLETQLSDFDELRKNAELNFKSIAQQILDNSSNKLKETSKESLEATIKPYKESMEDLKTVINSLSNKTTSDFASFDEKIKNLVKQTNEVSAEANKLAVALKVEKQKQGFWGEQVLERIFDISGLTKGVHYTTQDVSYNEDEDIIRPDFVVSLPEGNKIIVDSKVSLNSYVEYINAENTENAEKHLKAHVNAINTQVANLAKKKYTSMYGAIDFVVVFIPIESALNVAIEADPDLWDKALKNKVILTTPTSLISVLKVTALLWKNHDINSQAEKVVEVGDKLYQKLMDFYRDFHTLNEKINDAQEHSNKCLKAIGNDGKGTIKLTKELQKIGGYKYSKSLDRRKFKNGEESLLNSLSSSSETLIETSAKGVALLEDAEYSVEQDEETPENSEE